MCVLLKFLIHATHQTCLRSGWLQNAKQVSALVNIYSSMGEPLLFVINVYWGLLRALIVFITTHGNYNFTSHPKDKAQVSQPGLKPTLN